MGILQMQENNRLEILKRRWWEGGQCPREEDHRAKGQFLLSPAPPPFLPPPSSPLLSNFSSPCGQLPLPSQSWLAANT